MGAKGLGCMMCVGNSLRSDSTLRTSYEQARSQPDGFSRLVESSPCAATKMYLIFRDARLGETIVDAYNGSIDTMAPCANRQTMHDALTKFNPTTMDENGLPKLCEVSMAVERLIHEQMTATRPYLFKSSDEVLGMEDHRFGLLTDEFDNASYLI